MIGNQTAPSSVFTPSSIPSFTPSPFVASQVFCPSDNANVFTPSSFVGGFDQTAEFDFPENEILLQLKNFCFDQLGCRMI